MASNPTSDVEPCRCCGAQTERRIGGNRYCSMECLQCQAQSCTKRSTTYCCLYYECDWSVSFYVESDLSTREAHRAIETHRLSHSKANE